MREYKKLFVGGDLSGIQKFLYNISSKKAAVSLKGRSQYLGDYMRKTCNAILQTVKIAGSISNEVIYCSGGKFYLITENSPSVREAIGNCQSQLIKELWDKHYGQLALNIAFCQFDGSNTDTTIYVEGEEEGCNPGILWKKVNEKFAKQKNQKFKDLLTEDYDSFFKPIPVGGITKLCAITGVEHDGCVEIEGDEEGEKLFVLPSVKEQIQKGEELRKKENSKTFKDYAEDSKLGVLRMDVDGLGTRFINGFNSIKDYKNFSERLSEFFGETIVSLSKIDEFRPNLNIIYSGGDDLFVVGRWDKVIDFAERVHKETIGEFSGDGITISGGMISILPKYPISKAAELAGEAEDAAKHFNKGEKNAFCFLGKTISWNKEFEYVKTLKNRFVSTILTDNLSKGILHKLMLYSSIAEGNELRKQLGKTEDYSYQWHICYYLARYKKRYDKNDQVKQLCNDINQDVATSVRKLELIAQAARWAELILRFNCKTVEKSI